MSACWAMNATGMSGRAYQAESTRTEASTQEDYGKSLSGNWVCRIYKCTRAGQLSVCHRWLSSRRPQFDGRSGLLRDTAQVTRLDRTPNSITLEGGLSSWCLETF